VSVVVPSRVCLLIVNANEAGRAVTLEAAGFASGLVSASGRENPEESAIELSVRSKAERIEQLGFATPDEPILGTMGSLIEGDWRTRGLGVLWQGIPASEVLLAASPLGHEERGRVLISMIAVAEPGAEVKPGQLELLSAIHPLLVRRAVMAIGETRATSNRWLTAREQEVLDQLVVGKSVRVIAEELQRSPHTVHDHVKSLHRKLGASSRGELVAKALGHTPLSQHERAAETRDERGVAEVMTTPAAGRLHASPAEPGRVEATRLGG